MRERRKTLECEEKKKDVACVSNTTPTCPPMGCGVIERHLEMAQPTKKVSNTYMCIGTVIENLR